MSLTGPSLYLTPAILINAPTGISWSTIPNPRATTIAQAQEQMQICYRVSSWVDMYCGMPLKCTYDVETVTGPNERMTINQGGFYGIRGLRFPILATIGGQYATANSFPLNWSVIPPDYLRPSQVAMGSDGSLTPIGTSREPWTIEVAGMLLGTHRNGWKVQVGYLNGWPTTTLTTDANVGDTAIQVDDVSGWYLGDISSQYEGGGAPGVLGQMYDPLNIANEQSLVAGSAATTPITSFGQTVQTGPGTLTLTTGLQYAHAAGTLFSSIPYTVIQAAIYRATFDVQMRGTTAVTAPSLNGSVEKTSGAAASNATEAELLLQPFVRIF